MYLSNLKYTDVRVSNTGLCYWSSFGDIKVINSFEVSNYPYDAQIINMTFGSWIYTDDRIHLELNNPAFLI